MTKNYFVFVSVTVNRTSGFEIGFKTVDIDLVTEEEPITELNYASFIGEKNAEIKAYLGDQL